VPNPDEKLRPSMTANVTIEVATVPNVLRVPNAALRFKPDTGTGGGAGGAGGRGQAQQAQGAASAAGGPPPARPRGAGGAGGAGGVGGQGGLAGALPGGAGNGARRNGQTVYVLTDAHTLQPVSIRPGISDGHYTQVVSGDLQPGMKVVTGLATVKVEGQT